MVAFGPIGPNAMRAAPQGGHDMNASDDSRTMRYVRLLLHDHPLRAREYVGGLAADGTGRQAVLDEVVRPAQGEIIALRDRRRLNPADARYALRLIQRELARDAHAASPETRAAMYQRPGLAALAGLR